LDGRCFAHCLLIPDLGVFFLIGFLLLARTKYRQGDQERKSKKLVHDSFGNLSRSYRAVADGDAAGVTVTVSILSRRKRWTFA
jgi:hypothetical protein